MEISPHDFVRLEGCEVILKTTLGEHHITSANPREAAADVAAIINIMLKHGNDLIDQTIRNVKN